MFYLKQHVTFGSTWILPLTMSTFYPWQQQHFTCYQGFLHCSWVLGNPCICYFEQYHYSCVFNYLLVVGTVHWGYSLYECVPPFPYIPCSNRHDWHQVLCGCDDYLCGEIPLFLHYPLYISPIHNRRVPVLVWLTPGDLLTWWTQPRSTCVKCKVISVFDTSLCLYFPPFPTVHDQSWCGWHI